MKILVTGANGLLGSTLCPYLSSQGHTVLRQSRTARADVALDLTDYPAMMAALEECMPDVIVNLAALANVDACEEYPDAAYRANTLVVENLARWIGKNSGKTHLIQISTDQVYEGPGPHSEDRICLTNYYAFSKYAGELAARPVGATILRTNFFGQSQCPDRTTLSDWLVASFKAQTEITLFEDVLFSPLDLGTLAMCIAHAARLQKPGTFNLGSHNGMSKADFAQRLALATGLSSARAVRKSIDSMTFKAYRPKDMRMVVDRFQEAFAVKLPDLAREIEKAGRLYWNENR